MLTAYRVPVRLSATSVFGLFLKVPSCSNDRVVIVVGETAITASDKTVDCTFEILEILTLGRTSKIWNL